MPAVGASRPRAVSCRLARRAWRCAAPSLSNSTSGPPVLWALVRIPHRTLATSALRDTHFEEIVPLVEEAWTSARAGNYPAAMALNSLAYARLLGHSLAFSMHALEQGAWAAGLSGKGPAEVALLEGRALGRTRARYPAA